jgi:hypothetical protein
MGVPISEVGYTSATTGLGDHEVHNGHVVALEIKKYIDPGNLAQLRSADGSSRSDVTGMSTIFV